jgi:hypothetical protein
MADLQEIVAQLVERIESRYYGKYRGEVLDNNDPSRLGRLKVKVPRLAHDEELGWALPAFPFGGRREQGCYFVPEVKASVWVEFEGGDLSHPIWSGTWYGDGELPEGAGVAKKVIKTASGHKVVFDDDDETVEITDSNGNTVRMERSTITVAAGSATKIVVDAPQIELVDDAAHPLVFGDTLIRYLTTLVLAMQTHMHPGELALGVFPVTPMVPGTAFPQPTQELLSTQVKTG